MATAKTVQMERFAFDVFVYTLSRFDIVVNVPLPKCSENTYEQSDFLSVLSNGYIAYQLKKRDTWIPIFEATFKSNGLKKFQQISELLEELLKKMDRKPKRNPMGRIVTSLALINELIQFLYSKNRRLFLNDLASSWKNYIAGFEEEFKEAGGFSHLYSIHTQELQVLNKILEYFIPNYCNPYGKEGVSCSFIGFCNDPSLIDSLKESERQMQDDVLALATNLGNIYANVSRYRRRSGDKKTKASSSLKNTGLGIPPHEELYQDSNPPLADKGASAEKLVSSSVEEASVTAHADVKLQQKQSVKTNRKKVKGHKQPSTEISSPEGRSKALGELTGSPISPEGVSKDQGGLTGSPLSPGGPWKCLSTLTGSPLTPEGRSKDQGGLSGLPLTPEGRSKDECIVTGSLLSSEGRSKDRGAIKGSPLSPEGRSKDRSDPFGSPLTPKGRSKDRSGLSESPLTPEGRSKDRCCLSGSPLTPEGRSKVECVVTGSLPRSEGRSKDRCGLSGSPLSPEGRSKDRSGMSGSPLTPKGRSKDRSGLSVSPLTPEGRSKDRSGLSGSPLTPEGRPKGLEALANSPSSPQEQKLRRGSPQTPEGISRLEQKRLKHLQRKKN